jgi:hypothetical protein
MARPKTSYVCGNCGARTPQWQGQCPACEAWNTLELAASSLVGGGGAQRRSIGGGGAITATGPATSRTVTEIAQDPDVRAATGIGELDRVLGGGLVSGSVVLLGGDPGIGKSTLLLSALAKMDQWIAAIQDDSKAGTAHEKVVRNKPATLREGCNTRDAVPTFIAETQQMNAGQCATIYPVPPAPRAIAGAPVAADVIKCTLKPVAASDYPGFTPAQLTRLQTIYPSGVCN